MTIENQNKTQELVNKLQKFVNKGFTQGGINLEQITPVIEQLNASIKKNNQLTSHNFHELTGIVLRLNENIKSTNQTIASKPDVDLIDAVDGKINNTQLQLNRLSSEVNALATNLKNIQIPKEVKLVSGRNVTVKRDEKKNEIVYTIDSEVEKISISGFGGGGGAKAFTDLTDTPSAYIGFANKVVSVKADETGLQFTDAGSGSGTLNHAGLSNLDFNNSGHTGFQPSGDYALNSSIIKDHTGLSNIGTNSHAQIDNHISATTNIHGVSDMTLLAYRSEIPTNISQLSNDSGYLTGVSGYLPVTHLSDFQHDGITHINRTALDLVSGVNTGDEGTSSILFKLGISILTGSNTGDNSFIDSNSIAYNVNGATVFSTLRIQDTATIGLSIDTNGLKATFLGSATGGVSHNLLPDLQGGSSSERFHLDGAGLTVLYGLQTNATHTGDVTGSTVLTIAANAVTYDKMETATAFTVLGNPTAATAGITEIVAGSNGVLRRSGTGVVAFGTIVAGNIAANAVTTGKVLDNNITLAKITQIPSNTVLGNNTGSSSAPIAMTIAETNSILGINNQTVYLPFGSAVNLIGLSLGAGNPTSVSYAPTGRSMMIYRWDQLTNIGSTNGASDHWQLRLQTSLGVTLDSFNTSGYTIGNVNRYSSSTFGTTGIGNATSHIVLVANKVGNATPINIYGTALEVKLV